MNSEAKGWPAFWSALTPQEVAAALMAAPRVAGEWVDRGPDSRRLWNGEVIVSVIDCGDEHVWRTNSWVVDANCNGTAPSLPEAQAAADAALTAAGWVLL